MFQFGKRCQIGQTVVGDFGAAGEVNGFWVFASDGDGHQATVADVLAVTEVERGQRGHFFANSTLKSMV